MPRFNLSSFQQREACIEWPCMHREGEQVHGGEHHGEVLLAVPEVVFKVVAVGLEDVEAFVLDLG
jgi:hypothetical protein